MKRILLAILLAFNACAVVAQPSSSAVDTLQAQLHGKQFFLRGFALAEKIHYQWADAHLESKPADLHGFCVFFPDKVKLRGSVLSIDGQGAVLAIDANTHVLILAGGHFDSTLEIDIGAASADDVLPQLPNQLFFSDSKSALAAIPSQFRSSVPAVIDPKTGSVAACKDCPLNILKESIWIQIPSDDPAYVAPAGLKVANPLVPQDGTPYGHIASTIAFVLDEAGTPTNLWITKPAGYGIDFANAKNLRASIFKHATYQGSPIAVVLRVKLGFTKTSD